MQYIQHIFNALRNEHKIFNLKQRSVLYSLLGRILIIMPTIMIMMIIIFVSYDGYDDNNYSDDNNNQIITKSNIKIYATY